MTSKPQCPICNNQSNYKFSYQSHKLYLCPNCHFEFISSSKLSSIQNSLYESEYFQGGLSGVKGYQNYQSLQNQLIKESKKKLEYIKNFTTKRNLLDLGSGTGVFLKIARNNGYTISGNDISKYALKHLRQNKIKAFSGSIEKSHLPKEEFNIITAWDVIEHLKDPVKAIRTAYSSLKPKGFLFITTPDTLSPDAKLMGKNWYGYKKIPEHIGFFNRRSITKLLEDSGFKIVEIRPWGFYRNLDFILDKLKSYSPFFSLFKSTIRILKLSNIDFFVPLTDFIIVAKK